mmetsp:Transcript_19202/g.61778  ORF Transcript_19202/g.61778 Transcript_19202/m.61778 type:complete len:162 (+) Transcript_19202:3464-3949(+)
MGLQLMSSVPTGQRQGGGRAGGGAGGGGGMPERPDGQNQAEPPTKRQRSGGSLSPGFAVVDGVRVEVTANHRGGDIILNNDTCIVRAASGGVIVQNKAQLRRLLGADKCLPVVGSRIRQSVRFCPCPSAPGHKSATSSAHTRPPGVTNPDLKSAGRFIGFS